MEKRLTLPTNALFFQIYAQTFLLFTSCAVYSHIKRTKPFNDCYSLGAIFLEDLVKVTIAKNEIDIFTLFSNDFDLSRLWLLSAVIDNDASVPYLSYNGTKSIFFHKIIKLIISFSKSKEF